jgi:hypothetical protein
MCQHVAARIGAIERLSAPWCRFQHREQLGERTAGFLGTAVI